MIEKTIYGFYDFLGLAKSVLASVIEVGTEIVGLIIALTILVVMAPMLLHAIMLMVLWLLGAPLWFLGAVIFGC